MENKDEKKRESKQEKFKRIAEARTNKIITTMRLLSNCSNKNNYEFDKEDVEKIIKALEEELKDLKNKFNESIKTNKQFKL